MKYQQITKLSRLLLALVMTVTASQLFAQSNDGIFFQAVARDNFSNAAKDRKIFVQTSIIQSTATGSKLLIEEHQATTDASGVFSISIGKGNRVGGASSSLSAIDWSKGPFFLNLKVAITPIGGNSSWDYTKEWVDMGTINFGAVPFAYYAAQVAGFDTKLNVSDSAKMLLPYAKTATLNTLSSNVDTKLNTKLNIADSLTKYITPSQLASYNFSSGGGGGGNAVTLDTTSLSNRINLKANTSDVTTAINLKANTSDVTTSLNLKAPIASPIFTGTVTTNAINTGALSSTSISAPTFSSTPKALSYTGSTINWDPSQGLNAAITLTQNSSLSFTTAPPVGSYGTVVLTQDATGTRTITLPTITNVANKVLGSTSTSTVALSTAGNSKDILNFYFDGTNCYWNIGQGYGSASSSGSVNLSTGVTGTLAVANGGTGATNAADARTNLGLVIGTNVQAPLVAGTDYLAPNGSAANLTNFPTFNQNTTGNAATVTTNANLIGDVTSVGNASTVVKINGTSLAGLSTGILKNTTTTGVPTIAVAGTDYQAPITLTTTGTGAATLSGTTLNIPTPSSGSSNTHSVGESYGGGVVFYTWDNGAHGLIVSLTDQCCNGSTIGRFSAGTATNTLAYNGSGGASTSNQTAFTTITGGGVGAGKKNTLLILASQGLGNGNKYAARYANEYSILSDGVLYDDWYLGSVDEYHLLANNYPQVLANNSFTPLNGPNKDYWTSTEINLTDAFTVYIRTNSTTSNIFNVFPNAKSMFNNGGYGNVRAIRSF